MAADHNRQHADACLDPPIFEEAIFMASTDSHQASLSRTISRLALTMCVAAAFALICQQAVASDGHMKRTISYQGKTDLFANYYEGPQPSGRAASMYVSPLPIPANVGHTYTTYQPLMPHEYLYKHTRSHYSHAPGAGWTRTKVRYSTYGLRLQDICHRLNSMY
jgi:hypothetical protein